ncbi:extracellular solute-binding protein [Actinocrispum wychmicini]|uniref:Raffinose/stachyose/melibiose transport system substrate-binding protein n=1 Tax=Actinocrispum wychmicini TaxID=1213861 RepID=A0A4R2JSQ6_9PSEU|nr:extracellular solute-binding protein [Actinocrispum wychmicini]TCO57205.1 raffinose/stachyose/melibiose transport system substrate-binding protein [Actinocrispum wychmicini]
MKLIAVLVVLVLAACAPGSANKPAPQQPAGDVKTDVAAMGQVTLTVWDQETRGGQEAQITELNKRFQAKYPNVKINRVARSFDDLRSTIKLGLTGTDAPDVAEVNNGKQDMGAFVKANLIRPLDGYAAAYQWTQRFPDSVRKLASYPDTGDSLGEGKLYGVPQTGELVGIYYNKAKLTQLGLQPPKTWADFDAALAAARNAGQVPIQFGNLEKSAGPYLFALAMHRFGDPAAETKLATGRADATWPVDANKAAARQVVDWVDKGYLTTGFAGLKGDDSWAKFGAGEGVFHLDGTWIVADLKQAMGDNVGFMLPPEKDGHATVTGGTGLPWAISAKSKNPDAAAAYINFITSSEAMKVLADNGNLPVLEAGTQSANGLQKDAFDSWQRASTSPALVPYLDYATSNAYEVISGATEQLMAKQLDVDAFLGKLQADLEASRGGH